MFTSSWEKKFSLNPSNNIIVECGCFKGASSISLSIFSKIVNRKLIYDSFEGLPDDDNIVKRLPILTTNW